MEFSFDRTKSEQSSSQADNQPSSSESSNLASDRLKKAIERNRAKQAARDAHVGAQLGQEAPKVARVHTPPPMPESIQRESQQRENLQRETLQRETLERENIEREKIEREKILRERQLQQERFNQQRMQAASRVASPSFEETVEEEEEAPPKRPFAKVVTPEVTSPVLETSLVATGNVQKVSGATRRSVAKPEDTEFVPTPKRSQRKVASQVNYTTANKKKATAGQGTESKLATLGVKACWAICVIAILRLVFADGGVVDYYSQKGVVNNRLAELERIKKDNSGLLKEIERMRNDKGYQKKLVRDNLGFIAGDEFLVLFPKEK